MTTEPAASTTGKNVFSVEVISFGYKYGVEAGDLVFDARFIPNPYYVDSLKPLNGKDKACADYVFGYPITRAIFQSLNKLAISMAEGYVEKGWEYLKICIGCTGGQHRSVALVEGLARVISNAGFTVKIRHREMDAGRY